MEELNNAEKIIEQELKEGEKDHKLKIDICEFFGLDDLFPYDDNSKIMERLEEIQGHYYDIQFKKSKKEKALEIIRNKRVYIEELFESFKDGLGLSYYNSEYCDYPLTQEEYDLVKEIVDDK